jgi:hypothetical protein
LRFGKGREAGNSQFRLKPCGRRVRARRPGD